VFRQILADGHQVGNHTMSHENGLKTPKNEYFASVENATTLIESELFRPPYGKITPFQFKYIFNSLKKKVIFWTWLAYDFDAKLSGQEIIKKAERIKGGDILVFHDSTKAQKNLEETLETIILMLQKRNFQFKNSF
jgi:peptidoglycan/xylan/chitin deacetylase (PgdA/CDA1 family)